MTYRDFLSLTDEEIKFIMTEIFNPVSIGKVTRDVERDEINVEMTTTWYYGEDGSTQTTDITDDVTLTPEGIDVDYSVDADDLLKWKQFLLAKGCNPLLKDNPYLEEDRKDIKRVCVNLEEIYLKNGAHLASGDYIDFFSDDENEYYNLRTSDPDNKDSKLRLCNGETCSVVYEDTQSVILKADSGDLIHFTRDEYDIAVWEEKDKDQEDQDYSRD